MQPTHLLRRPDLAWPHPRQALLDQIDRPLIARVAQDLRHPRRVDLRPLLQQPPHHRLQRIEHRPRRLTPITRRVGRLNEPPDRAPVNPQPRRDLTLRDPIRSQRPDLRPLHRAAHLPSLHSLDNSVDREGGHGHHHPRSQGQWRTSRLPEVAHYWAPGVTRPPRRSRGTPPPARRQLRGDLRAQDRLGNGVQRVRTSRGCAKAQTAAPRTDMRPPHRGAVDMPRGCRRVARV
jgi:hypothetical protein